MACRSQAGPLRRWQQYRKDGTIPYLPRQTLHNRRRKTKEALIAWKRETRNSTRTADETQRPQESTNPIDESREEEHHPVDPVPSSMAAESMSLHSQFCLGNEQDRGAVNDHDGASVSNHDIGLEDDWEDNTSEATNPAPVASSSSTESMSCDPLLYTEASLTVNRSQLLVTAYANRHKLPHSATDDLLKLIALHCPAPNRCLTSTYKLQSHQPSPEAVQVPLIQHFFCPGCYAPITDSEAVSRCPNSACHFPLEPSSLSFFIELPVLAQIQQMFARPGFCKQLLECASRQKQHSSNVEDIYDGAHYQALVASGLLGCIHSLSFTFNTDGVAVFRSQSSKYSFWPIYLMINELPVHQRKKEDQIILAGLWFGTTKAHMETYLQQLAGSLQTLEQAGAMVHCHDCTADVRVHGYLIALSCDLPARAGVLNTLQFNGYYGCNHCEQPGSTCSTARGGHLHVFPYIADDPKGPPRTAASVDYQSRLALQEGKPVKGIKGPSWLSCLSSFSMGHSIAVDYMHGVLEGVTRSLLNLWIDATQDCLWSVPATEIDKRIEGILVPSMVNPLPRAVTDRKHWKAKEFRSWLLWYSLPTLRGILREEYYQHFALLVIAIWLLLQSSISHSDINTAERLLNHFCLKFSLLYDERYMVANVHQLLHLADCVRNLGPLWSYSCFLFEGLNGRLKRHCHGTQAPHLQIVSAIRTLRQLPSSAAEFLKDPTVPSTHKEFYRRMNGGAYHTSRSRDEQLTPNCSAVGKWKAANLDEDECTMLCTITSADRLDSPRSCQRIHINGHIIWSKEYNSRSTRRNNSIVAYTCGSGETAYGEIKKFVHCSGKYLCVVNRYTKQPLSLVTDSVTKAELRHIHTCKVTGNTEVIAVEAIIAPVIIAQATCENLIYVAELPNKVEIDL